MTIYTNAQIKLVDAKGKETGEVANLEIGVDRADGVKCPRCWHYDGIPDNPLGICDRCADVILEGIASGHYPEEWKEAILTSRKAQLEKYAKKR